MTIEAVEVHVCSGFHGCFGLQSEEKRSGSKKDDNSRNIMDYIKEAKAGLLGNGVDNKVKIIGIWY